MSRQLHKLGCAVVLVALGSMALGGATFAAAPPAKSIRTPAVQRTVASARIVKKSAAAKPIAKKSSADSIASSSTTNVARNVPKGKLPLGTTIKLTPPGTTKKGGSTVNQGPIAARPMPAIPKKFDLNSSGRSAIAIHSPGMKIALKRNTNTDTHLLRSRFKHTAVSPNSGDAQQMEASLRAQGALFANSEDSIQKAVDRFKATPAVDGQVVTRREQQAQFDLLLGSGLPIDPAVRDSGYDPKAIVQTVADLENLRVESTLTAKDAKTLKDFGRRGLINDRLLNSGRLPAKVMDTTDQFTPRDQLLGKKQGLTPAQLIQTDATAGLLGVEDPDKKFYEDAEKVRAGKKSRKDFVDQYGLGGSVGTPPPANPPVPPASPAGTGTSRVPTSPTGRTLPPGGSTGGSPPGSSTGGTTGGGSTGGSQGGTGANGGSGTQDDNSGENKVPGHTRDPDAAGGGNPSQRTGDPATPAGGEPATPPPAGPPADEAPPTEEAPPTDDPAPAADDGAKNKKTETTPTGSGSATPYNGDKVHYVNEDEEKAKAKEKEEAEAEAESAAATAADAEGATETKYQPNPSGDKVVRSAELTEALRQRAEAARRGAGGANGTPNSNPTDDQAGNVGNHGAGLLEGRFNTGRSTVVMPSPNGPVVVGSPPADQGQTRNPGQEVVNPGSEGDLANPNPSSNAPPIENSADQVANDGSTRDEPRPGTTTTRGTATGPVGRDRAAITGKIDQSVLKRLQGRFAPAPVYMIKQ